MLLYEYCLQVYIEYYRHLIFNLKDVYGSHLLLLILYIQLHIILLKHAKSAARFCYFMVKNGFIWQLFMEN